MNGWLRVVGYGHTKYQFVNKKVISTDQAKDFMEAYVQGESKMIVMNFQNRPSTEFACFIGTRHACQVIVVDQH